MEWKDEVTVYCKNKEEAVKMSEFFVKYIRPAGVNHNLVPLKDPTIEEGCIIHCSDPFEWGWDEHYISVEGDVINTEEFLKKYDPEYKTAEGLAESEVTQWSDSHYNNNYVLTEEDIENGYVRLDAYTVAKVWRIGSKDDSGALWHTFKVFPRYGEKNPIEREIKAMYNQIKCLAKIEGVKLDD